eukprot:TRINITY_DN7339_c0_g1_i1.p1 TRINITY_DN7339_c0_g1~~TRINITY_DN7339_c0_g1_i1.p1  ORF type:complete len:469 (+),score=123.74 TRINITY_DN7339_c0_g1_i1:1011-2417(+)
MQQATLVAVVRRTGHNVVVEKFSSVKCGYTALSDRLAEWHGVQDFNSELMLKDVNASADLASAAADLLGSVAVAASLLDMSANFNSVIIRSEPIVADALRAFLAQAFPAATFGVRRVSPKAPVPAALVASPRARFVHNVMCPIWASVASKDKYVTVLERPENLPVTLTFNISLKAPATDLQVQMFEVNFDVHSKFMVLSIGFPRPCKKAYFEVRVEDSGIAAISVSFVAPDGTIGEVDPASVRHVLVPPPLDEPANAQPDDEKQRAIEQAMQVNVESASRDEMRDVLGALAVLKLTPKPPRERLEMQAALRSWQAQTAGRALPPQPATPTPPSRPRKAAAATPRAAKTPVVSKTPKAKKQTPELAGCADAAQPSDAKAQQPAVRNAYVSVIKELSGLIIGLPNAAGFYVPGSPRFAAEELGITVQKPILTGPGADIFRCMYNGIDMAAKVVRFTPLKSNNFRRELLIS